MKNVIQKREIFELATLKIRSLFLNSQKTIPQTFIESERAEHDWTIAILTIFVSYNYTRAMFDFNKCSISFFFVPHIA